MVMTRPKTITATQLTSETAAMHLAANGADASALSDFTARAVVA